MVAQSGTRVSGKLFGAATSDLRFEAQYAAGLQRLIAHLNSEAAAGPFPDS